MVSVASLPKQSFCSIGEIQKKFRQSFLPFPEQLFVPTFSTFPGRDWYGSWRKNLQASTDTSSYLQPQGLHSLSPGHTQLAFVILQVRWPKSSYRSPSRSSRGTLVLLSHPALPMPAFPHVLDLAPSALSLVQEQLFTCSLYSFFHWKVENKVLSRSFHPSTSSTGKTKYLFAFSTYSLHQE